VAYAVEQNCFAFDVVADAVVTHAEAPLADGDMGELASLRGVVLEAFERFKDSPMGLGIEPAQVTAKAVGNDETVARHVRSAWVSAVPSPLLSEGRGAGRRGLRPFRLALLGFQGRGI
jgi:hypothetical protein